MIDQSNNITRNVLTQLTGSLTEAGFTALVSAYNLPAGLTLGLAQAVAKGTMQGIMQNCYDDVQSRALSKREVAKHNMVFDYAERTFFEFAVANMDSSTSQTFVIDKAYLDGVLETAEHVSLEAIRQSELKKIEVLGRYYGREFYVHGSKLDFQDMHQIITMVGTFTFRQIVMIRLINEGFNGYDKSLFITNPSACVEINRLRDYGIWKTTGAAFGINESGAILLGTLVATDYTKIVCESLMLDQLSDGDVKIIIEGLRLSQEGAPQRLLTEEDYDQHTSWQEFDDDGNVVIDGGEF